MTDPSPPHARPGPRWDVDARSLRLWVISGLATAYLVAWWCFAPAPVATDPGPAPAPAALAPTPVWWHELPPAARPAVVLPPGWEVATGTPRTARPIAAPIAPRGRPTRPVRIRTRSS